MIPGFGWQLVPAAKVGVSVDPSGPTPGVRSVSVEFSGDGAPGIPLIHQLVLLQPKTRYSLSFMARADSLVSGGPPVIIAFDAAGNPPKVLGQSKPLSPGTSEWSAYQVDFTTDENTAAVTIALQRLACSQSPCPIFGRLWLSRFSLVKKSQSKALPPKQGTARSALGDPFWFAGGDGPGPRWPVFEKCGVRPLDGYLTGKFTNKSSKST